MTHGSKSSFGESDKRVLYLVPKVLLTLQAICMTLYESLSPISAN